MDKKKDYGSFDTVNVMESKVKDTEQEKVLDYDILVEEIGEFGLFQKLACFLLWFPAAAGGVHVLMYSFTGLEPTNGYQCVIDGCDSSYDGNIPYKGHDGTDGDPFQSCNFYKPNITGEDQCFSSGPDGPIIKCIQNINYTDWEFEETTVTRFGLVCDNKSFTKSVAFTQMAYMLGLMVGSMLCGFFSDRLGRRYALLGSIILSTSASLAGSWMPDYWSYLSLRFLTAVGAAGLFNESFSLTVELMGSKQIVKWLPWITYRNLNGNTIQIPYALGEALLGVFAIFLRDYVTLQWVMSAVLVIQVPIWFLIPESPRWLLSKGRTEEAREVMMKAARQNGKPVDLSKHIIKHDEEVNSEKVEELGFADMFKTREILKITIVMFFCWPILAMGYYGLGLSMTQLGGNLFINFILGALVEIPGYLLCMLVIDVWGRKPFFVWCLLLTGACCITAGFLQTGPLRTGIALAGKLFAAGNFSVVYMYTAEIYPTIIRNTAIGSCSMMGRIGNLAAPFIALYLPEIQKELPMLIMGGASVIGGLLAILLPETLGMKLPDKIEDVQLMRTNGKSFWKCVTPTK